MNLSDLTERQQEWLKRLALCLLHRLANPELPIEDTQPDVKFEWSVAAPRGLTLVAVVDMHAGLPREVANSFTPGLSVGVLRVAPLLRHMHNDSAWNYDYMESVTSVGSGEQLDSFTLDPGVCRALLPYLRRAVGAIESLGDLAGN